MYMTTINISNMKCNGCVTNAKKALEDLPGLESVEVDLQQANAVLTGNFNLDDALQRLTEAGYPAERAD
ncbi:MAG TPA: heavy-metal-associated domain-containing protein [Gammaproteobacteria bacterium]|nr:heavy-metal-associated domain-containing protein [Gammaproteobacteria bacterium]HDH16071.1 heavy-metal-associated domain-containing protein [Gammaproteobacteria bacterium]HDZ78005.1 heavy-metal-associated domain-containing protein [Gammaproteobacteria bacterium]HEC26520.1 heavy-metal-associated domain-containing protein [Gammaproteobacteria bacterium]